MSEEAMKARIEGDVSPLLVAFLLFQRQFMQSFMQAGIK